MTGAAGTAAPAAPRVGGDGVTERYLRECADARSPLRGAFDELVLPPTYVDTFGDLLLSRPLFAEHSAMSAFADDLGALFDLLTSLPERCFNGDLDRYCVALGIDERQSELMRSGATGRPERYSRADAYHDGTRFRLLEFNVGSELGGIDAAQMNRAFMDVPAFADFARRERLAYVDTAAVLADELRRAARRVGASGDPVVALIEAPGALEEHAPVFAAIEEAMRRYGISLLLGEIQQLSTRRGKLVLDGAELDVLLRYYTAEQLLDYPDAAEAVRMVARAHRDGATALFTSLECGLVESKANLALLHDPRHRASFTSAELALVDRIVPWTRAVGIGAATPGDRAALVAHCRERRDSLILKRGVGCGGAGALLGRELTDRAWSEALEAIAGQDYIAQEVVVPAPEPVLDQATGEIELWQANWGIFATDDGYAGAFVRALRERDGAIITYGNRGTRGTCVFTHPETGDDGGPA
jgi:hypothetical protein